jgi:hypothetical protein
LASLSRTLCRLLRLVLEPDTQAISFGGAVTHKRAAFKAKPPLRW